VRDRYPVDGAGDRERGTIDYATNRGPGRAEHAGTYPAHLHIDLLPELQGQGFGRRLIETLDDALARAGVSGVHLEASAANTGAVAFYPRVGFTPLPSGEGTRAFGRRLPAGSQPPA
jgi:GNAT superfamily N-acetyltransferase